MHIDNKCSLRYRIKLIFYLNILVILFYRFFCSLHCKYCSLYQNNYYIKILNRQIFRYISADLRSWRSYLYDDKHIPRKQTDDLCAWIDAEHNKEKERVALLVGAPGSGKSVVMHDVLQAMETRDDVYVLGLKSDQIGYETIENQARNNGISSRLEDVVNNLSREVGVKRVILLVDQIDALSIAYSAQRVPGVAEYTVPGQRAIGYRP